MLKLIGYKVKDKKVISLSKNFLDAKESDFEEETYSIYITVEKIKQLAKDSVEKKERLIMNNNISETIFSGKTATIPMADVQHYEKHLSIDKCINPKLPKQGELEGISIITDKTKWNFEHDSWGNAIYISNLEREADDFIKAWCFFRYEKDIKSHKLIMNK